MARLQVTYVRSGIGYKQNQKDTLRKLGLRRLHQTVTHEDSPSIRGMVDTVRHLVTVQEEAS